MIRKIEIFNYQSHEQTELELHNNVNSIIGNSNQGKTAILRALLWALTNRPIGNFFISHWADECSVKLITNKGIVERKRNNKFNGYIINNKKKLKAIKTDVPDEIKHILNIDNVNIQKQLDSPFLLSSSSGEVAKFFNKTIKLDLIDKVLYITNRKEREVRTNLIEKKDLLLEIDNELKNFNWIHKAEQLVNRLKKIEEKINNKQKEYKQLNIDILLYETNKAIIYKVDIDRADNLIKLYEKVNDKYRENKLELSCISSDIREYKKYKNMIIKYIKNMKVLEKQIPKNCPLCGMPKNCPLCGNKIKE